MDLRPSVLRARYPHVLRPGYIATVLLGGALAILAFGALPAELSRMSAERQLEPFLLIAALVFISELRPVVMSRVKDDPVSISQAFVFAALFVWGPLPAMALIAAAVLLSELLARKPVWKVAFNVGNYTLAVAAAGIVLGLGGWIYPLSLDELVPSTILLILGSWAAYHLVNLALVATVQDESWWDAFTDEFWFYTWSTFAVLALSPLVAVVAIADVSAQTWLLLPLLLLPLLAVQRAVQMDQQRTHRATHDALTGLANRQLLSERIDDALARPTRPGERLVVLLLDIDAFKNVNDGLGHAIGDALLVDIADRLRTVVRPGDTLARFSGDEFALVCESIPDTEVEVLIQRIQAALLPSFTCATHEISLTASIGVAPATPGATAQSLLREADSAMYRAKGAGRDQAALFHQTMHDQAAARLNDQLWLRRALERDEMRAHFQPVVNLGTGTAVGFEALIRWEHQGRLISPDQFIPLAEETGLILPLGGWMLENALTHLQQWRQDDPEQQSLWVAVNLSPRQLTDPDLIHKVSRALTETGVPPSNLHLEITETAVMRSPEASRTTLDALRNLGVHLIIDDFGTGYSSLARLKRLPVTALKVDRSFVDGLGRDASDLSIVDAIVNMADSLSLGVIAEGVETLEQLGILRSLGAPMGQGFLWARAMPADGVPPWLRSDRGREQRADVTDLGKYRGA